MKLWLSVMIRVDYIIRDHGQTGTYQLARRISTDKRACVYRFTFTCLICRGAKEMIGTPKIAGHCGAILTMRCHRRFSSAVHQWARVTQLLRQSDAQVFKKYSQMKLRMKREALEKLNRRANEMAPGGKPMLFRPRHCAQTCSNDAFVHSSSTVCTNNGAFGPR